MEDAPVEPLAEGVGPIFEWNGKKWKFTRGNLKYNISDDIWTVLDYQYEFVNAGGLGNGEKLSSNSLGTTPNEIGLFAWGTTGVEDAQKPWTIRFDDYTQKGSGDYWPSTLGTSKTVPLPLC